MRSSDDNCLSRVSLRVRPDLIALFWKREKRFESHTSIQLIRLILVGMGLLNW